MTVSPKHAPEAPRQPTKAGLLRRALLAPELSFLMEAHNGLSAKIVEEAGFRGIWASGLSISAALGVRDNNEASWTQVLEILEFMSDATTIPILVDGDTGYGNFNNVRRLVTKLCQRGIAGVCIEDKLFPKTNSFLGEGQPLADIDEFCGKIKAGKDSQLDPDFCVIARIEAFIAGWGLDEALRRAEAYHRAGADALLIHSKKKTPDEIFSFMKEWGDTCPIVIVPTMYYSTPTEQFEKANVSTVIWANHNLRAAISGMRAVSKQIYESKSLINVEDSIAPVKDVFALSGQTELAEAERRYLPQKGKNARAIILAATRGESLGPLTEDRPKCMIDIRGKSLLRTMLATIHESGIRNVTVVSGYCEEAINVPMIDLCTNTDFATTGEVASLACASDPLGDGPCLISYGDILYRSYILDQLQESDADITVVADALWKERQTQKRSRDFVQCDQPFHPDYLEGDTAQLCHVGTEIAADDITGEWVGLALLSPTGAKIVRDEIEVMATDGSLQKADMPDLFNRLVEAGHKIRVQYITGHWLDIDDPFDLAKARNFL
ncbi:phosphoenolpyruvate mutase [Rhodospirillaceae bacterium AH-315-P19]|nr:phosphoenolpyruvate mutase [Rhodospirillaceae bacterium AH-315-P19]